MPKQPTMTLAEQIEAHNKTALILIESYEKSVAHASFMIASTDYPDTRRKYERQLKRFKMRLKTARASFISNNQAPQDHVRFAHEPARRIVKEADGHHCTDDKVEYLPLNDETCADIARGNGYLTAGQVHHDLLLGKTIYTSFRRYRVEA